MRYASLPRAVVLRNVGSSHSRLPGHRAATNARAARQHGTSAGRCNHGHGCGRGHRPTARRRWLGHGGGKQITSMLDRLGIEAKFERGIRVTDAATLQVVEMVLAGPINSDIVRLINHLGGAAVGLTGCDGGLAKARLVDPALGRVGEVETIDRIVIDRLIGEFIPVIAPLATGPDGDPLNVNADVFAAKLAAALGAEKLVLLTDIAGVLDAEQRLIPTITPSLAAALIDRGVIAGGMIPKVENALATLAAGVTKVHIIDGRLEHALLLEIFTTDGVGTQVVADALPLATKGSI